MSYTNKTPVNIIEEAPTASSKLNPSLSITESTVGTVTTKTLVKTMGDQTYTKTIAMDSSDNSITVSSWS